MRGTCGNEATTPLGLTGLCVGDPGLLASSQPWALSRNPFGIQIASGRPINVASYIFGPPIFFAISASNLSYSLLFTLNLFHM